MNQSHSTLRDLILSALRTPRILVDLDARQWETVITVTRRHGLAGRWYAALAEHAADLPQGVYEQLRAEHLVAAHRRRSLLWELRCVARALNDFPAAVIVLKGGAYALLDLPPGNARMSADLDILVPEHALTAAETALAAHGWRASPASDYDDRYYREWMHELPPLQHTARGTVLDLHHNILPRTARISLDATSLVAAAVPAADGLRVLAPADMVIHSLVHGFQDGEFLNGLRDVLDVYELLSHFAAARPGFWNEFTTRVIALGVARPGLLALDAVERYFALSLPPECRARIAAAAGPMPLAGTFAAALDRVLIPSMPAAPLDAAAARLLKTRAHWQRMPPALLARHLGRKLWRRLRPAQAVPSSTT